MFKLNGSRFGASGLLSQTGQRSSSPQAKSRKNPPSISSPTGGPKAPSLITFLPFEGWGTWSPLRGTTLYRRLATHSLQFEPEWMHQNLDPFGLNKTLSQTVQDFGFQTGHRVGATLPLACVVCVAAAVSQTRPSLLRAWRLCRTPRLQRLFCIMVWDKRKSLHPQIITHAMWKWAE